MFQVGDRVRRRYFEETYSAEGTVICVRGDWVEVKHDSGGTEAARQLGRQAAPRFEYKADEIEFLDPLLRLVQAL